MCLRRVQNVRSNTRNVTNNAHTEMLNRVPTSFLVLCKSGIVSIFPNQRSPGPYLVNLKDTRIG